MINAQFQKLVGRDPRFVLFAAVGLDVVGQLLLLFVLVNNASILGLPLGIDLKSIPVKWTFYYLVLYPSLGWLFGSYTILRWRRLPSLILVQRVLLTVIATLVMTAVTQWLVNPDEMVWLLHRRVQILWFVCQLIWSIIVRVLLRSDFISFDRHRLMLLASNEENSLIQEAWRIVPNRQRIDHQSLVEIKNWLANTREPCTIAVAPNWRSSESDDSHCGLLEKLDPHRVKLISPEVLFERQQERLPPTLLCDGWLSYDDIPWAASFGIQTQVKRAADLLLALFLMLLTSPLLLLSIILIWIDDPGPVFYYQQRTGFMGVLFTVYKLRTMRVQPPGIAESWTQLGDQRITRFGKFLRRVRIDELPQLINVLKGDMSLIGPRPERPEIEKVLEREIPHYRMRHWMRPGLSGWAQVCAPYSSSIRDSELKLSYDLYYLKKFSIWLDLIILFSTIKTILKAGGR